MTNFYHYTSLNNLKSIIDSGWIEMGRLASTQKTNSNGAVNLTTDTDHEGHGLPDGRAISDDKAGIMNHHGEPGNYFCIDHTKCRLSIELSPDDPKLVRATDQHASEDGVLCVLELAGWRPTQPSLSDEELVNVKSDMDAGVYINKSPTWWYYFDRIPIANITWIEIRSEMNWVGATVDEAKEVWLQSIGEDQATD